MDRIVKTALPKNAGAPSYRFTPLTASDREELAAMMREFYASDALAGDLDESAISRTIADCLLTVTQEQGQKQVLGSELGSGQTEGSGQTQGQAETGGEAGRDLGNESGNHSGNHSGKESGNETSPVHAILFWQQNEIAGYLMYTQAYSTEYGGNCLWLEDLYIKAEFRGTGLGALALKWIEDEAKRRRCAVLRLEVAAGNGRAIQVYEKAGFQTVPYQQMWKHL